MMKFICFLSSPRLLSSTSMVFCQIVKPDDPFVPLTYTPRSALAGRFSHIARPVSISLLVVFVVWLSLWLSGISIPRSLVVQVVVFCSRQDSPPAPGVSCGSCVLPSPRLIPRTIPSGSILPHFKDDILISCQQSSAASTVCDGELSRY